MKKFLPKDFRTDLTHSAWRRIIHLWKPMGAWTLFVWAIITIILAPISSAVLSLQFFRSGELVIGNMELLSWLLSPVGIGYILLGASLSLTAWVVRFSGISQIVTNDIYEEAVNFRDIILRIIGRIPVLFRLCLVIVTAGLLLILPLVGGLGFIYKLILDTYDINYYMTETPLEWYLALLVSACWFVTWLLASIYLITRSLLTLPAYLHSQRSIRKSFSYAWNMDLKQSKDNVTTIIIIILAWIIIRLTADGIFFFISTEVISWISNHTQNVRLIALATGLYLTGSIILDAIISFLGFSHVSTLITKLYYSEVGVPTGTPPSQPKFKKLASFLKNMLQPKRLIYILSIVILSSLLISGYMIEQIPESKPDTTVQIAAHRAGPPPAPENTLEALGITLQTDAEYAEIDVQLSNDSTIVVMHDLDLMRIANNPARISETNYNDLQDILDKKYSGRQTRQNKIYTLDEFLDAAHGQIKLMVELKQSSSALVGRTVNAIRQKDMVDETIIISLDIESLRQVQDIAPEITVGYVSAFSLGNISQLPVKLLAISQRSISNQLTTQARSRDLDVYAWTVNRASTMANMIELGVDGIITDNPELAIRVRNEIQTLTTTERLLLQFQQFVIAEEE